jgi:Ca-activated chloride channel family protein
VNFEFQTPLYFLLLLPTFCIYICPRLSQKRYFVHLDFFKKTQTFINKEKLLFLSILFLFIVALASPITYESKSPNHRKGRDLVLVLDTSGSMGESGYDNEKKQLRKFDSILDVLNDFILHRYDDNLGVVVFGDFAFAASPLTYDRKSLIFVLKYLDVGIAGNNTAIGDGLIQAIKLFKHSKTKNKVIILLSDGYQNSGSFSPKDAILKAKKANIKIYTIGVGKTKDYDKELLDNIAKKSGGEFFEAKDLNSIKEVYKKIDTLEPSHIRSQNYLNKTQLFDIPLFISIVLLIYILIKRQKEEL